MARKKRKTRQTVEPAGAAAPVVAAPVTEGSTAGGPLPARGWRVYVRDPIAIGVAILLFARPWRDGLTYPVFNLYFVGFSTLIAALIGARLLMRGEPVRRWLPGALLAGFVVASFAGVLSTVQLHATYSALLIWTSYFFVFIACAYALKTREAVAAVLGMAIVVLGLEASWALIHFYEVLPLLRQLLSEDPSRVTTFFGQQLNRDLWSRLMINRAFGTALFPNSLAALMVLGIPLCAGAFPIVGAIARDAWRSRPAATADLAVRQRAAIAAFGMGCATFVTALCFDVLMSDYVYRGLPLFPSTVEKVLVFAACPIVAAVLTFFVAQAYGIRAYFSWLACALLAVALMVQMVALYLTYSRGGALAFIAAASAAFFLAAAPSMPGFPGKLRPRVGAAAGLAFLGIAVCGIAADADDGDPKLYEFGPLGIEPQLPPDAADQQPLHLTPEGIDVGTREITDVSTMLLRTTYWKVGLRMALDSFWTGVGLGNFATVYGKYQYVGAGTTKMAHNDYLQVLAETGILGFLLFYGFCFYLAAAGAVGVFTEPDTRRRWSLAGHYAALLGFMAHSLIDFDFQNPMTATFFFAIAGAFIARIGLMERVAEGSGGTSRGVSRAVAAGLLVTAFAVTFFGLRLFLYELAVTQRPSLAGRLWNIGDRRMLNLQRDTAHWTLVNLADRITDPRDPPHLFVKQFELLVPDRSDLASFGVLRDIDRVLDDGRASLRPLGEDEPATEYARVFVTDPIQAKAVVTRASERRLKQLAIWDEAYENDPELASLIADWYAKLYAGARNPTDRERYAEASVEWARKAVARNSQQPVVHAILATSLWNLANAVEGARGLALYDDGLEERRTAVALYPASWQYKSQLADALNRLGAALIGSGMTDKGSRMQVEAERVGREAALLRDIERWRLDLLL